VASFELNCCRCAYSRLQSQTITSGINLTQLYVIQHYSTFFSTLLKQEPCPGRYKGTPAVIADNTLDCQFEIDVSDRIWVTDITYIRMHEDPHTYLADTFTAIAAGHKQSQINDLLPWNYVK